MSEFFQYYGNSAVSAGDDAAARFGAAQAEQVLRFHESLPGYRPTELRRLDGLAGALGVAGIYVKDESSRFGLNAFKALGGSWSVGRLLAERAGIDPAELTFQRLLRPDVRAAAEGLTLVTATDGNHGRGVAWTARALGLKAVVYLPQGSALERLRNIQALGAEAEIVPMNYDNAVRLAARHAEERGWVLVQDTAWEGYEKIPEWIMQGYTTMALEIARQLGDETPTHIFLQAGVGAMAGALTGFFADYYRERKPAIVIVEPNGADCVFRTVSAEDGQIHTVRELRTIMAGLCCGEPCTIGLEMLRRYADYYVTVPDWVASKGMRVLASPVGGDAPIVSGESGAVTAGLLAELMGRDDFHILRGALGLKAGSRVLCVSTEGDTDRENYRRIVWDGACPRPEL